VKQRDKDTTANVPAPVVSDDPDVLAVQAREAIEKSAVELRKQRVPIATEPPTVFRP
jgi:hypothetical protein